ncbi:hypothetical protein K7432_016792 [Basidiobolus ranarum]|uniref:Amino acid transporter transmembrane domain-containing protein n=1 Tax=Basidiobolus ranarum TaxID=34480 RepID=A0ABR2VLA5_9FUNG
MAYTAPAGFSLDGADPRLHHENLQPGDEKHAKRSSVVPFGSEGEIPLEAYLYWGDVKRQIDRVNNKAGNKTNTKFSQLRSKLNGGSGKEVENENPETDTNIDTEDTMPQFPEWDLDGDRMQAERALRSASWQAVFYLITTDILGPSSAPWAFSQLGYVTGVLMFFFMGVAAAYTGWQLWTIEFFTNCPTVVKCLLDNTG